jgi:hypothetical protein
MNKQEQPQAYGVFKPIGHVVISFHPDVDVAAPQKALLESGIEERDLTRYTPEDMERLAAQSIEHATPLASLGQELNLVKAHRELARQGYGWLVVRVDDDKQAQRVADIAKSFRAERAQHYGRFIIEELIEHGDDLPQVAESPARGLDSQTLSGREKDR